MATETEITPKERPRIMGRSSRTPAAAGDPRWLALVVLCAGMLMIVLDATIVNVALPSIQSDLGFAQSSLAWVVNAYLIPSVASCCWRAGSATSSAGDGFSLPVSRCSRRPPSYAGCLSARRCWSRHGSSRASEAR